MIRAFVALIIAMGAYHNAIADGISVSQSVDRTSVAYEDSVRFEIKLEWQGSQAAYLFTRPLDPTFDRFKMGGFTSAISSSDAGASEITTKTFLFTLLPTSPGPGRVEPVIISYVTWPDSIPGELVTEAMTVTIAEPIPVVSEDGLSPLWWGAIALVVLGCGIGGFLYIRSRNQKPVEPLVTPAQDFLSKLTTVKEESGADLKKFQTGLYRLLVEFLAARLGIEAETLTDDELEAALGRTDLDSAAGEKLTRWLTNARRDKFRPVEAQPGETLRLEAEIRELFGRL